MITQISEHVYIVNGERLILISNYNLQKCLDISKIINSVFSNPEIHHFSPNRYFSKKPSYATKAEFMITDACNFACIYCYSSEHHSSSTLDYHKGTIVIDRIINNAIYSSCICGSNREITVSFHGGGEPLCASSLVYRLIDYASQRCMEKNISCQYHISTNLGIDDQNTLKYLIDNRVYIHVSMDGIASVQNHQRPFINGGSSFDRVASNLDYLQNNNASFSVRMTITDDSLNFMLDSVNYICKRWPSVRYVKLAPLENTPASYSNDLKFTRIDEYISLLPQVIKLFDKHNIPHNSIYGGIKNISSCGSCSAIRFEQLIITASGDVVCCHEGEGDEKYTYGSIDRALVLNEDAINQIKKSSIDSLTSGLCSACSHRAFCLGGCMHRRLSSSRDTFCSIQKDYINRTLQNILMSNYTAYPSLRSGEVTCSEMEVIKYVWFDL